MRKQTSTAPYFKNHPKLNEIPSIGARVNEAASKSRLERHRVKMNKIGPKMLCSRMGEIVYIQYAIKGKIFVHLLGMETAESARPMKNDEGHLKFKSKGPNGAWDFLLISRKPSLIFAWVSGGTTFSSLFKVPRINSKNLSWQE